MASCYIQRINMISNKSSGMNRMKKMFFLWVLLWFISGPGYGQPAGFVWNKGVAGNSSSDLLARVKPDVIDLYPDMVIVMAGTNDLLNSNKMVTVAELTDNLERLTDSLSRHGIDVVLVSPPPVDSAYLFSRHNPNVYVLPPNDLLSEAGAAMQLLCQKKGYLFIDAYNFFKSRGIPRHNDDDIIRNIRNSGQKDGVHFTQKGNAVLATLIFKRLSEKYGHLNRLKIICFGDSLTYGAYMDGKGTATGSTYPAVLKGLLIRPLKMDTLNAKGQKLHNND